MHDSQLVDRKREIREAIQKLRDSMSMEDTRSKSRAIESKLWQLIDEQKPASIMFYIAFGSEVRTQDCIDRALDIGKIVIVPACTPDGEQEILPCRLLNARSEVEEGRFGIPEPKPECRRPFPPESIDLIVVPGVAFDERGYRIGYGGGYYDRFLVKCTGALSVGLAYEIQIVESAFPAKWDLPVQRIITEDRVIT